jgi:ketosteroid isomerase-like protein
VRASDKNKALVQRILEAYGESDFSPLREVLDPKVVYHSHSPRELFRFAGRHEGLANGVAALSAIASDYTIHALEVHELVGEADVVWATTDMDYTDRRSKKRLTVRVVSRWQVRDGKVVSVEEYFDTADTALKQGLATARGASSRK